MHQSARERLLQAKGLIESVMEELDTAIIDCDCEQHQRHYRNWSDAQVHLRLSALTQKLDREAHGYSVTLLSGTAIVKEH
jgi:hypothetical protein